MLSLRGFGPRGSPGRGFLPPQTPCGFVNKGHAVRPPNQLLVGALGLERRDRQYAKQRLPGTPSLLNAGQRLFATFVAMKLACTCVGFRSVPFGCRELCGSRGSTEPLFHHVVVHHEAGADVEDGLTGNRKPRGSVEPDGPGVLLVDLQK